MDREQTIRETAYRMWEQAGRPVGHDLEFWLQAEALYGAPGPREAEQPAASSPSASAILKPAQSARAAGEQGARARKPAPTRRSNRSPR